VLNKSGVKMQIPPKKKYYIKKKIYTVDETENEETWNT